MIKEVVVYSSLYEPPSYDNIQVKFLRMEGKKKLGNGYGWSEEALGWLGVWLLYQIVKLTLKTIMFLAW
jgi:hypothetical protein